MSFPNPFRRRQLGLLKWMLQLPTPAFFLVIGFGYCVLVLGFALAYLVLNEPEVTGFFQAVYFSIAVTSGINAPTLVTTAGKAVTAAEAIASLFFFGVFVSVVFLKLQQSRTTAHLAPRVAVRRASAGGIWLEFRLIVYPSSPLFRPEPSVALYCVNEDGERDTLPLELHPVSAVQVRYYLVFRAVVPTTVLLPPVEATPLKQLPVAEVAVSVTGIDMGSDSTVHLTREYRLPQDAEEGCFATAITRTSRARITGVDPAMLNHIERQQPLLLFTNLASSVIRRVAPPECSPLITVCEGLTHLGKDTAELSYRIPEEYIGENTQIIPCASVATGRDYSFEFALRTDGGDWSSLTPIGRSANGDPSRLSLSSGAIEADEDTFTIRERPESAELRLLIHSDNVAELLADPWLVAVAITRAPHPPRLYGAPELEVALPVPAKSQMVQPEEMRRRVCSATSVSMVLDYWGANSDVMDLARAGYHPGHDMYGIWPASIWAASRYGFLGFIARFPSWSAVEWLLERKIPIVASINYQEGELRGAPMARTPGHLVVITGVRAGKVLVNDPAAPDATSVPRQYDLKEFERAWLHRKGIGYVIVPPALARPASATKPAAPAQPPTTA